MPNQEHPHVRTLWHKEHVRKTVLTAYSTPRRAKKWKKVVREPAVKTLAIICRNAPAKTPLFRIL